MSAFTPSVTFPLCFKPVVLSITRDCVAENCYFWFCVIHCLSPLLNYSVSYAAGRNTVAGCGYALTGTCRCLKGEDRGGWQFQEPACGQVS